MRKSYFSMAVLFILIFCFSSVSFAGLTVTSTTEDVWGKKRVKIKSIAFDSSYASGGESLTKASIGLAATDEVIILPKNGYTFEYDYTNETVKVKSQAPAIVYEEQHTATASAGITLDYPAAWILNVVDSSGNNCQWVYSGTTTLSTNQFALSAEIADNTRTGVTVDAADTYYITYATQAWKDLYDLLVQNEAISLSSSGASVVTVASGNTIFAFGCMRAGATTYTPVDFYDTPTSSEVGVDFGRSGTSTSYLNIALHTDAANAWITYLKYPASGTWLRDRFVSGVSFDATSGAVDVGSGVSYVTVAGLKGPILTWNYTGFAPSVGDTTQKLVLPSTAVSAANTIKWNYPNPTMTIGAAANLTMPMYGYGTGDPSSGVTLTNVAYTWGYPYEIPNLINLEVPDGRDLSNLTGVKVMLIGR